MIRLTVTGVLCAALAAAAAGRDKAAKAWAPPAVPEGFEAVVSKDDAYRFAVPKKRGGVKTASRTTTANGVRTESLTTEYR